MVNDDQQKKLAQLLADTAKSHHRAFIETDGYDLEWPLWYAEKLQDEMTPILGGEISISELVYSLVHLSREQPAVAPEAWWPAYYAEYFLENYPQSE